MRLMWYMTMPLATPAPPTMRTRMPKPIWMVVACWWKKSTIWSVVTSGRGGGITRASAKKMIAERGVERGHDPEHDPDVALARTGRRSASTVLGRGRHWSRCSLLSTPSSTAWRCSTLAQHEEHHEHEERERAVAQPERHGAVPRQRARS